MAHELQEGDISSIVERSSGYSGADMANLCKEAAMVRDLPLFHDREFEQNVQFIPA